MNGVSRWGVWTTGLAVAVAAVSATRASAGWPFNTPSTLRQQLGYGFGAGYHAPLVLAAPGAAPIENPGVRYQRRPRQSKGLGRWWAGSQRVEPRSRRFAVGVEGAAATATHGSRTLNGAPPHGRVWRPTPPAPATGSLRRYTPLFVPALAPAPAAGRRVGAAPASAGYHAGGGD